MKDRFEDMPTATGELQILKEPSQPLFSEKEYKKFRESFIAEVVPKQQQWLKIRRGMR